MRGLEEAVGRGNLLLGRGERVLYGYDATVVRGVPRAVARPATTGEVAAVLRLCHRERLPVIPRGAGTGLSGGAVPVRGGVVLDLGRMNRIRRIDRQDLYAEVEAGVNTRRFQEAVEAEGLFFPPDPSSAVASTLGGNLAENAGGPRAFKYGVFRDYTLGLTVVLADGSILRTGGRTVKNVSGYDLTRLFVGSEGTLGVITEAILKLIPPPEARRTLMAGFLRLEEAAEAVSAIIAAGLRPSALELMDESSIRVVEEYLHLGLPLDVEAILLIEVDGPAAVVEEEAGAVADLCRRQGASLLRLAREEAEAAELWRARKAISPAVARIKPTKISEDATVPRSRIPEMVRRLKEIARRHAVTLVVFGHAGDGNLHPNILCDARNPEEMERVWRAVAEIFRVTLELGGTLSGEHGIGVLKAPFLGWEHGEAGLRAMRAIKAALDPHGILNPGKLFPDQAPGWPVPIPDAPRRPEARSRSASAGRSLGG
ncbi:MAG: FAD-linked oxidase C-terminal domain-containing protein [Bacillota bacterium]|nr:FAD-linked oxidase C-terminal domain-containing protein [Bacillota bacterium]